MSTRKNSFPYKKYRDADSRFIVEKNKSYSFNEFNKAVNNYSYFLKNLKVRKCSRVAIISENNSAFIFLTFATWALNAVPVPINTKLSRKEVIELLKFIKPKIIFYDETNSKFSSIKGFQFKKFPPGRFNKSVRIDHFVESSHLDIRFDLNQTAVIIFTSGSTAKPKGVEITFNNLIQSARIGNKMLTHKKGDAWLASLPFYHIGGFSIITRSYIYGAKIVLPSSLSAKYIKRELDSNKVTHLSLVSAQLKRISEEKIRPNKEQRITLLGGGFTDSALINRAIKLGWRIYRVYGSTEVSSFAAIMKYDKRRNEATGRIINPNRIFIVKRGKKLKPYELGEIVVKSPIVFKKYFNNPVETKEKLRNGLFYTGDIGYLDKNDCLYVEARRTDLIVSGGENIISNQVEQQLKKHSLITDAFVFPLPDKEWGQIVTAAITTKNNLRLSEKVLKDFLKKKIASYKIPKKFFLLKEFPRNQLGKVQKDKLINQAIKEIHN